MNNGLLRGPGRRPAASTRDAGTVLASARSASVQSGITTATDITGLSITFEVKAGEVVEVELLVQFCFANTLNITPVAAITDAAGTITSEGRFTSATANAVGPIEASEEISTPGTYTRKAQLYRGGASGTVGCGFNANSQHRLKATIS